MWVRDDDVEIAAHRYLAEFVGTDIILEDALVSYSLLNRHLFVDYAPLDVSAPENSLVWNTLGRNKGHVRASLLKRLVVHLAEWSRCSYWRARRLLHCRSVIC